MASGRTILDTEVRVAEGELQINNFLAACGMTTQLFNNNSMFRELTSGPVCYCQTIPFGVGLVWAVKGNDTPSMDEKVGLMAHCLAEKTAKVALCCRVHLWLVNSNPQRSIHKEGTEFSIWKYAAYEWSPSYPAWSGIDLKLSDIGRQGSGWLQNGALLLRLKVEFVPQGSAPRTIPAKATSGPTSVCHSLKAFLTSGDMADVEITIGEEQLTAHSVILCARSQVFRTMLSSPMKEGLEKKVVIEDLSVDVMKGLLEFLYTGSIELPTDDDEIASGFLKAAHRFELKDMLEECEQLMVPRVSISTAASWFELADLLGCQELRDASFRCILQNLAQVQGTDGYEQLVERRPSLLKDIIAAFAPPVRPQQGQK